MKKRTTLRLSAFCLTFVLSFTIVFSYQRYNAKAFFPAIAYPFISEGAQIAITLLAMAGIHIVGDAMAANAGEGLLTRLVNNNLVKEDSNGKYLEVTADNIGAIQSSLDGAVADFPISSQNVIYDVATIVPANTSSTKTVTINEFKDFVLNEYKFTSNGSESFTVNWGNNIGGDYAKNTSYPINTANFGSGEYKLVNWIMKKSGLDVYNYVQLFKMESGSWVSKWQVGCEVTSKYTSMPYTVNTTFTAGIPTSTVKATTVSIPYSGDTTKDYDKEKIKVGLPPGSFVRPKVKDGIPVDSTSTDEFSPDKTGDITKPTTSTDGGILDGLKNWFNSLWDWLQKLLDAILSIPGAIVQWLTVDWSAVKPHMDYTGVFEAHFQPFYDLTNLLRNIQANPKTGNGKFYMRIPEEMGGDNQEHCVLDLSVGDVYITTGRNIIKYGIWISFLWFILKTFSPKLNID